MTTRAAHNATPNSTSATSGLMSMAKNISTPGV